MHRILFALVTILAAVFAGSSPVPHVEVAAGPEELFVDPAKGKDSGKGTKRKPFRSVSAAIATLPEPLEESVTIHLLGGEHESTGGIGTSSNTLQLMHRMRPGVHVQFVGADGKTPSVFAWGGKFMVDAREGEWRFERVQIGSFKSGQRRGVHVRGPARVVLEDVTFRLRSDSDAGIHAEDGGRVSLRGRIRLNEQLHEKAEEETFCGIFAVDHGVIEFDEFKGSSLDMGNGSLSVRNYGRIRLGCDSARITCWTKSNNLTISNSGRIDIAETPTVLRAVNPKNTPIGLEHDGHILAENAHIEIIGPNDSAIALQKSSTFTCNDIVLTGEFEYGLWASSGSMFVGRFLTDVSKLKATTGAQIHVEKIDGKVKRTTAESGGLITLPDRVIRSK
jgi:hypothetical protein